MSSLVEPAVLKRTDDGTPFSERYGDVYHSSAGAHAQARHVFLAGNGLPERWRGRDHFTVLETGFGLGVNFLATWLAWREDPRRCSNLEFISVEKHPFSIADLTIAQATWPEFADVAAELRAQWPLLVPGEHRLCLAGGAVSLRLIFGDALIELPKLQVACDALYLDGFSPACNPELWSLELCQILARLSAPGATLATWTVAGHVRRALREAGFSVEKRPGFAGKRQMLAGTRDLSL